MLNREELLALAEAPFGPAKAFSVGSDEFSVTSHLAGEVPIGIFKNFAMPIIPFLDMGNLDILMGLWPEIIKFTHHMSFQEALHQILRKHLAPPGEKAGAKSAKLFKQAQEALDTIGQWEGLASREPIRLKRSLERARIYCWIADQKLAALYSRTPLPEDLVKRLEELVRRLKLAFAAAEPFYHLEALVGDTSWVHDYQGKDPAKTPANMLDAVPFFLPMALKSLIKAKPKDWNGLNWQILCRQVAELDPGCSEHYILVNLAKLVGASPEHILFAANVLEFIPQPVGGKTSDRLDPEKAFQNLRSIFTHPIAAEYDSATVLSEINALIRFLNWLPLNAGEDNFQGRNWTYAAVCDTTRDLFELLNAHPELWKKRFGKIYMNHYRPQLLDLDAESARGRFLLQLILRDERLKEKYQPRLSTAWFNQAIADAFAAQGDLDEHETESPLLLHPDLVGGKPFGVALSHIARTKSRALIGACLNTFEIEQWLRSDHRLWKKILFLNHTPGLNAREAMAQKIRERILKLPLNSELDRFLKTLEHYMPGTKWAVRSSSSAWEESKARGIYDSLLRMPTCELAQALRACVASYYSSQAVLFRHHEKAGDLPILGIWLLPFLDGPGGGCEVIQEPDGPSYTLGLGTSAAAITDNQIPLLDIQGKQPDDFPQNVRPVVSLVQDLSRYYGPVQIEYILTNPPTILQLEFLTPQNGHAEDDYVPPDNHVYVSSLDQLGPIEQQLAGMEKVCLHLSNINLDTFPGRLLALLVRCGKEKIVEIRANCRVSRSGHLVNLCRALGIRFVGN